MEMKKFEMFLYQAPTAEIEQYVAKQPLSEEEQYAVWNLDENCFIEAMALNPCLIPQLQLRIATNKDYRFAWDNLAENLGICEKVQILFARKKDEVLRCTLSYNENICQKAASILCATADIHVLNGLTYNVKIRETPWGREIYEKIKNDPHYNERIEYEQAHAYECKYTEEDEVEERCFQRLCEDAGVDPFFIDAACKEDYE